MASREREPPSRDAVGDDSTRGARTVRLLAAAVAVLAVLVFARTIAFEFLIWDDDQHVAANTRLDPPTFESLLGFWRAPFLGLYVPASYTLFWLEALATGGPDPRVYHAVSVLLHAGNAALVVALLARLGARPVAAAVGGALFALHPLQVESVAWISEQRGLLASALGLAALLAYARPERRRRDDVLAAALFALALLAKPSAAVFAGIALVLEATILRRGARFAAPRLALAFAAAIVCLALTKALQHDADLHEVVPLADRPLVALDAIEFYARKIVLPLGLVPDHGRRPTLIVAQGIDGTSVVTALLLVALIAVPTTRRVALAPILVSGAALAPVLGLVAFAHQDLSTVADRYAYLALIGPTLLASRVATRATVRTTLAVAVPTLLALAALSFAQSAHWRDTESIFARTLEVNRRSWIAHTNRGLALQMRGDLDGAQREYEAALGAKPDHARALNNLGILLVQRGRAAEGEALLRRATEADLDYARPHMNLAATLGNAGRLAEAEASAARAVELAPEDPSIRATLGNVRLRLGRAREARAEFEIALRLRPRDLEARIGLGLADLALGDLESARRWLDEALEIAHRQAPSRVRQIEAGLARIAPH